MSELKFNLPNRVDHSTTLVHIHSRGINVTIGVSCKFLNQQQRHAIASTLLKTIEPLLAHNASWWLEHLDSLQIGHWQRGVDLRRALSPLEPGKGVGAKIRMIRLKNRLTQRGLANLIEIDPTHLSRIEHGQYQPHASTLERFECVLGILLKPPENNKRQETEGGLLPGAGTSEPRVVSVCPDNHRTAAVAAETSEAILRKKCDSR